MRFGVAGSTLTAVVMSNTAAGSLPGILLLRSHTQIGPYVTTLGEALRIFQSQYLGKGRSPYLT